MPAIAPASIEPLGLDVAASAMRVVMGRGGIGCAPKDPGGPSVIVSPALAPHAAELAQRVQCPCHMSAQWVCVIHGSADPAPPESTRRMWAGFRPWPGDRRSTDYTSVVHAAEMPGQPAARPVEDDHFLQGIGAAERWRPLIRPARAGPGGRNRGSQFLSGTHTNSLYRSSI